MKSEKLYQRITKLIQKQGFKELKLDPVIETKYIRDENLKKYLFTFRDDKANKTYALRPDLSLMSLIQFSKSKNTKKSKISYSGESYRKNKTINSQIGWEIYNSKKQSDEYEVIKNSIEVYKKITKKKGYLRIGNLELFSSVVNQLQLPIRWKQRIVDQRYDPKYLYEILKRLETNKDLLDESKIAIDKKLYHKMKKLGEKIKRLRTEKGYSQDNVWEGRQSLIAQIEKDTIKVPSEDKLRRIAKGLEISFEELIDGTEWTRESPKKRVNEYAFSQIDCTVDLEKTGIFGSI